MKFEKLGNIVTISKGKKHAIALKRVHQNFRYIQIEDLRNNDNLKYTDEKGVEVHENDLIIAWDGANAGTIGFGLRGMIGSTLARLRIKEDKEYNTDFIGYFLKGQFNYLRANATGATIPHIDRNSLESLKIPNIDFPEQYEIAKILSKSEDLIKHRKESVELLDKFLESLFYEMFGDVEANRKKWDKPELKKFGTITTGNTPSRRSLDNYSSKYIEWIKTDNIVANKVYVTESLEYLSEKGVKNARTVDGGALLVACIAGSIESIGRAALTNRKISFNQQINAIQPNEDISPLFLYWLFKNSKVYIQSFASKGMKKILNKGEFEKIKMIKPPFDLQNDFALIVDKVQTIKKDVHESLIELENLFGSLNQRAFKGELEIKNIPQKEMGDPFEGMDVPKDKLPGLDDILKQAGEKAEVVTEKKEKDEPKEKSSRPSPIEDIATVAGSISNYKPILEDLQPLIQKTFRDDYFSFENLKQAAIKAGWQYDFETLKNFVFELLRKGKLKQVFADAAFKSSFKESDADFKKIKGLNEQMYLQQATIKSL